ncbi:hypothetical protein BDA96_03G278600 [Sorghum bicolor]|uniref:DUF1639 domain-containing protein n=1 Tax=Sorghum bicolor TaxID=4558 RepID=A0A921REP7_SORBI|nr:hypothetical protein BDA96_03G278600 [Sorghum bicolor]
MRGAVEVHAIGRDVASPSPLRLRDAPALDMMRYQRLSPDCLPLGNGGGGGGGSAVPRKQASRSSFIRDDDAPAVATDGSRLASYLAASPPESKPLRARAPQPAPLSSATAGRSPAREQAHHHTSDSSDTASPSSTGGGGAVVGDVLLQWGHNKRSRCRRDSATAAPSAQRRQSAVGGGGVKIQRRASAPAEKLMPPPPTTTAAGSYTRGSNLRSASSFPSRASASASTAAVGSHHLPHHHRSVEERSAQKRSSPDKGHKSASAMDAVLHMESKNYHHHHHHHHDSPLTSNGAATTAAEKLGVERFELPRIYISLSRKEKEDDFLAMKGSKLPQRPKKRAKNVDKTLQFVFPGMWLPDLTKGRYEVREKKCVKKKRRGLKGMESMDSDSE